MTICLSLSSQIYYTVVTHANRIWPHIQKRENTISYQCAGLKDAIYMDETPVQVVVLLLPRPHHTQCHAAVKTDSSNIHLKKVLQFKNNATTFNLI